MTLLNSRIFSNSGPATARSSEPMPNSAAMVEAVLRGGTDYHHRADSALFARATTCFTSFHGGSIDQSCRWGQGKRVRVQGPHRLQYSEGHYQGVAARRRPSVRSASPASPSFNLKSLIDVRPPTAASFPRRFPASSARRVRRRAFGEHQQALLSFGVTGARQASVLEQTIYSLQFSHRVGSHELRLCEALAAMNDTMTERCFEANCSSRLSKRARR
jgi:hypothetical protein